MSYSVPLSIIILLLFSLLVQPFESRAFAAGPPSAVANCTSMAGQARLQGKVLDASGAAVVGARVTALREGCTSGPAAASGASGEFSLIVDPAVYTVKVLADGFQPVERVIAVPEAGASGQDVTLQVAQHSDQITVFERADDQPMMLSSATRTLTLLRDVPQSITVVPKEAIRERVMQSIGDVVQYVPGITALQGEGNRDQITIRGNSTTADFFVNGMRDDVQYYRDLYNLERVEALKGPNAMVFGRGGAGGVINRVTKQAEFTPLHEITLNGGSFNNKRFTTDLDQPFGERVSMRLNGVYESAGSFRKAVDLERYGISPTVTFAPGGATDVKLHYEHFRDHRTADRGIPSINGRPADVPVATFFGDPNFSPVNTNVNIGSVALEHRLRDVSIRNRTMVADYDKIYQNFVPGAVSANGAQVSITAYNNATKRRNFFNQTDATYSAHTAGVRHTLLAGIELGRQLTDNFRNTGFFNNTATSVLAPLANPVISTPVAFRQAASDADNHVATNLFAVYVQDQIELSRFVQLIAGLRFDYFDLQFQNNRNGEDLRRIDHLVSPRAGIVFKPVTPVSIYGSYSVSQLPSSGDQFSSLTAITQQVKPEQFSNYEAGVKWDVNRYLALTAAVYWLDRTNTRSTDPNDPTRIVQTGSQRTNGFEFGVSGNFTRAWRVSGGYAYQDAFVTSATTAAAAGAQAAQVPHHSFSLWNRYQFAPRFGLGLGILNRSDMFAAVDNAVTLPGYTRADAAVFVTLTETLRLQANVENLFDTTYYINANGNTNIAPGSPRVLRMGLTARF